MKSENEVKQDYRVSVEVVSIHEFTVTEVNSPEEAEDVVEQLLDEGEQGEVTDTEILSIDSFPVDTEEEKFN